MSAKLVIHRDPFRPALNVLMAEVDFGETIFQTLCDTQFCKTTETGIVRTSPFIVLLNGELILQKDWNYVLRDDDVLQLTVLPRGGGGGGSNLKAIIGAVIIAVAAFFTCGMSLAASVAIGAVAFVGLSLMTGAIPPPSGSTGNQGRGSTSPTYSLNSQGNSARLLEAIPRVYGRTKTFPDLASQPYSEYENNDQYLYQLFCVSLGPVEIEAILIDDTNITSFEDAEVQIIGPGQAVTLFPDNVVSSESVNSLNMLGPNHPQHTVLGPFTAAPAGTTTNFLAVDVAFPRGAARINDQGEREASSVAYLFQYRGIDDQGLPLTPWLDLISTTKTFATDQPQIITHKVEVPNGRYEVRGRRETNEPTDTRTFDTTQWVGLRSYLISTKTYGNVTLIATKMRATNALNSSTARKFSVISKGLVQKWNPVDGWGELTFSANPAWVIADMIRNKDYGRNLSSERLNMDKFYKLSQTWESRKDEFNGVFDNTAQLWEAVTKVARVGRAVPMYYAGVIDLIRDEPQSIPTAMFQPSNMVMGSFKTTYTFMDFDTPDHVVIEYIDRNTWKTATVDCKLPGKPARNPKTIQLFGVTDRDHAWREGISMAAANRDRRRSISFQTTAEGYIAKYNGLIRISHDVPLWGFSGRALYLDRATGHLETSEPIPFDAPGPHLIAFRKRDGSEDGPYKIVINPALSTINGEFGCIIDATPAQLNAIQISDGIREDYTFYQCGPTERRGIKALVMSVTPDSQGHTNIECINYAESVYTAELGGTVPPPPPETSLPGIPSAPIVDRVEVLYTVEVGKQNVVATAAVGAIYYDFEARFGDNGSWVSLGNNSLPTLSTTFAPGTWTVRVRGVGRSTGPWATWTGVIEATSLPTPRLDLLTASPELFAIGLKWAYNAETAIIASSIEIWAGVTATLGDASRIGNLPYPTAAMTIGNLASGERRYVWARVIDTAGRAGPWYNNMVPVTQVASTDSGKVLDSIAGKIGKTQLDKDLREEIESGGETATEIKEIRDELRAAITLRAQATRPDGTPVISGIGIGVEPEDGELVSQILLMANRLAIIDGEDINGNPQVPFVVEDKKVYINSAFIKTATIENAIIGLTLRSLAEDGLGNPLVLINLTTGEFTLRSVSTEGRTVITNKGVNTYYANGRLATRMGIWA